MFATDEMSALKQGLSHTITEVFLQFENSHQRLPTTEEFRQLFATNVDDLVGRTDWDEVQQGTMVILSDREQQVWAAVCEVEAELRFKRSEYDGY